MKKWVIAAIVALGVFTGFYFGSAYFAANELRDAALAADADRLDAAVDFPAVRESLKSQLTVAITSKMQNDPELKDNPFAGLAMMMAPAVVQQAVDAFVTPDGMSAMMRGKKPAKGKSTDTGAADASDPQPEIDTEYDWISTDRFRVRVSNKKTGKDGPSLLFDRRGVTSWKLIRIEIPEEVLEER